MREYLGFDVRISGSRDGGFTVHVVDSPAGEASAEFDFPFSRLEVENFVLKMAATGRNVRSAAMLTDERREEAESFGTALFDAVFDDDIRALLRSSRDSAEREGKGLRLRLRLADAPDLAQVPWEYLHGAMGDGFLALQADTPVVRYLETPQPSQPLTVTPPLSVLVMISNPANLPDLDIEHEWNKLVEATTDLRERGQLIIDRVDTASLLELQRRLRANDVHIFHYIGHGAFDTKGETGVLALEGEGGDAQLVPGRDLGNVLDNASALRLAVLNACEGARTSLDDPFAGVAQQLVERGLPAVVAMQFEITDDAASAFSEELYRTICEGFPIDEAVTHTRLSLFNTGNYAEWATPVLYMRSPDGRIFDLEGAPSTVVVTDVVPPAPPPGPLQATIERSLARADLPLRVVVDDIEVVVDGVVDDEHAVQTANDLVAASLAAAGVGRMITMNVSSLTERLGDALGGLVENLRLTADGSDLHVRGVVDSAAGADAVAAIVDEQLAASGLDRRVVSEITSIETAVAAALGRAGLRADVEVGGTDVRITPDEGGDAEDTRRIAETVLGTLGIGRMVQVGEPGGAPPAPTPGPPPGSDVSRTSPTPAGPPPQPPTSDRSRWPIWAGLALLVVLIILALGRGLMSDSDETPTTTSSATTPTTSTPTTSLPPTTPPTTAPPTTSTTVPSVDVAALRTAIERGLSGEPIENASVVVTLGEGSGEVDVAISGVVNRATDVTAVVSAAETAAAGVDITTDTMGIVVLEELLTDALGASGLGDLSARVDSATVTVTGTSNAEDWTSIEPLIVDALQGPGVDRTVQVGEVLLPDVAAAVAGLLTEAGYDGAVVTATTEVISVEYRVADDQDTEPVRAEIESIAVGAGYPQRVDVTIMGGQLPTTGYVDLTTLAAMLLVGGWLLLAFVDAEAIRSRETATGRR